MDLLVATKTECVAGQRIQRAAWAWSLWFATLVACTLGLGFLLVRGEPTPSLIGWLIYLAGAAAIVLRPRWGLYLIIFFTLLGDGLLAPWYPFVKNLSSSESLLYLSDALIFSPLESYLLLTLLSWLGRAAGQRKLTLFKGPLFGPVLLFSGAITIGLIYGIVTGGNMNVALWESRAIYYLPVMMLLCSNLIETRAQVSNLLWAAMLGLFVESLFGVWFVVFVLRGNLGQVERITEHAAAIHMNTLFVFIIGAWLLRASLAKRLLLPVMALPVALTYLATQRRASFLSLAIACALIAIVLYRENRRAFMLIIPPLLFLALVYLGLFWNKGGALALPARAVRSLIAPSARDYYSNIYRIVENINAAFTVRARPLTGVGFGNKFYMLIPLPDISFFVWWEYMLHNSILWIWIKSGIGGFVTMLFMIGWTIMTGVRALWRMPAGDLAAAALTATLYLVMHFMYAYVDMSWDAQSMVYVGLMMGLINGLERIAARPAPPPPRRWPWQPEPRPAPGLLSLSAPTWRRPEQPR